MLYRVLMAALLLSLGVQAYAMSIGNLTVTSNLGEPLRVRIAVTLDENTLPDDGCFSIVGPSSFQTPLKGAHLGLISVDGQRYVSIHTINPVTDPIIDLTLRTEGCGPTIQKDFVILLSPRGMNAEITPPMVAALPAVEQATAKPAPAKRAAKAKSRSRYASHRNAKSHHKTVRHHRRGAMPSGHFELQLDYSFKSVARYADQIAKERQEALNKKPAAPPPASHGDKLVLESGADIPLPPLPNDNATEQPGQTPQAAGVASQRTPAGSAPAVSGEHGVGAGPLPSNIAPTQKTDSSWLVSSLSMVLLLAVLLFFLALLIALWLKWRAQQSSKTPERIAADLNTLMPANPAASDIRAMARDLSAMEREFGEAKEETRHPLAAAFEQKSTEPQQQPHAASMDIPPATPKLAPMSDFTMEQFDTADHVLELAEVMLAFGRSNQAIETLSQYIETHPNQAVDPWIKLLDLYHQSNLRSEFEALAADLHKRFNVVIAEWSDYGAALGAAPLTLESLPHIMERLTSCWGTQACLDYLEKLLADNRGGQRLGFSLPFVRDILMLRDILKQIAPNPYRDSLTS